MSEKAAPNKKKPDEAKETSSIKSFLGMALGGLIAFVATVLAILIVVTVFAHKARTRCSSSNNKGLGVALVISLVLMWTSGLLPKIGVVAGPLSFVITLILTIVGFVVCKDSAINNST